MILPENDGRNGGGGVEVPGREDIRVESVWEKTKMKRKKSREWAGQRRDKMEWIVWWVVGLGEARGNPKIWSWPFFLVTDWLGCHRFCTF